MVKLKIAARARNGICTLVQILTVNAHCLVYIADPVLGQEEECRGQGTLKMLTVRYLCYAVKVAKCSSCWNLVILIIWPVLDKNTP